MVTIAWRNSVKIHTLCGSTKGWALTFTDFSINNWDMLSGMHEVWNSSESVGVDAKRCNDSLAVHRAILGSNGGPRSQAQLGRKSRNNVYGGMRMYTYIVYRLASLRLFLMHFKQPALVMTSLTPLTKPHQQPLKYDDGSGLKGGPDVILAT